MPGSFVHPVLHSEDSVQLLSDPFAPFHRPAKLHLLNHKPRTHRTRSPFCAERTAHCHTLVREEPGSASGGAISASQCLQLCTDHYHCTSPTHMRVRQQKWPHSLWALPNGRAPRRTWRWVFDRALWLWMCAEHAMRATIERSFRVSDMT